ncbi:MAG: DegT/DnrJ/EryC1/StrS family aminotransferase [Cyclobacteriaceae bacterium]
MNKTIPFFDIHRLHQGHEQNISEALQRSFRTGQFILGSNLAHFESSFANYCESKYCLGTSNGLDALRLCLMATGVGKNDEVIIPDNSFTAVALAVIHCGATPVFADVSRRSSLLDPESVRKSITKATKAIIPVHLYGFVCEMDQLNAIAKEFNLVLIEDFAQAHGAKWKGKKVGSLGTLGATSFYPSKNLGALGDAGAVTCQDATLKDKIKIIRDYGTIERTDTVDEGLNARLDDMQAAVLNYKLQHLHTWNSDRRMIAISYLQKLCFVDELDFPLPAEETTPVYHIFSIFTARRDELQNYLAKHKIETRIHYKIPLHLHTYYKNTGKKFTSLENSIRMCQQQLSLPCYPGLTEEEITRICDAIKKFFKP